MSCNVFTGISHAGLKVTESLSVSPTQHFSVMLMILEWEEFLLI